MWITFSAGQDASGKSALTAKAFYELAESLPSEQPGRAAASERTRAFSPTTKTTGFSITTMTRLDCVPGNRRNTWYQYDFTGCTLLLGRRMSRGLVYEA